MFRLRSFSVAARLGLTAVVAIFLLGLWASSQHIVLHHQNRDERPGVSLNDIVGAYHGVSAPSVLRSSLDAGHPTDLTPAARTALLKWLDGDTAAISREYDNLDLGDLAPSELLAANCLQCHGQVDAAAKGAGLALHNWDAVKKVAFATQIDPTPYPILIASTHAHALTMATMVVVLAFMLAFTRWPRWMTGGLVFLLGMGLLLDIGGWWATRHHPGFVYAIVGGGAAFNLGAVLSLLSILAELWLPARPAGGA